MKINTDAVLYYTRPDVPYSGAQDEEFFASIFFKYYTLTGDMDSKEMMDINTINKIFATTEGNKLNLTYAPNTVTYIQTAIKIAEDMTRKYQERNFHMDTNLYFYTITKTYNKDKHDHDIGYKMNVVPAIETAKQYRHAKGYFPHMYTSVINKNTTENVLSTQTDSSTLYLVILTENNPKKASELLNAAIKQQIDNLSDQIKHKEGLLLLINKATDIVTERT